MADAAREWQSDPWILHYTGTGKPWLANMTGTIRDRAYWREALSCPMLPELIDLYLASCDRAQLTHLFSSRDLLALGKPRLDEDALRDGVDALGADTSSAMAALVERLDVWPGLRAASVPVGRFRRYQGEHRDEELAFELAGMDGHLVYGPYACYPRGSYAATFDFTLEQCEPWPTGRLVIEVGFGSEFKAQHILDAKSDLGEVARTLMFDLDGEELSVEFRVFASGFARGRLRFGGVQLQRRLSKSEDRRPPRWRSVLARMGFG